MAALNTSSVFDFAVCVGTRRFCVLLAGLVVVVDGVVVSCFTVSSVTARHARLARGCVMT